MATYSINGYAFGSDGSGQLATLAPAELQIVAAAGNGDFSMRYLSDDPTEAGVSLSEYNLLLDGEHINDLADTATLEYYGLNWSADGDSAAANILSFNLGAQDGGVDYSFSLGVGALPELNTVDDASFFLESVNAFKLGDEGSILTINLPEVPDVRITGVLNSLFQIEEQETGDAFDFGGSTSSDGIFGDEHEVMSEIERQQEEVAENGREDGPGEGHDQLPDNTELVQPEQWDDLG